MTDTAQVVVSAWTLRDCLYLGGVIISCLAAGIAGYGAFKTGKRDLNSLGDSEIKTFEMIAKSEKDYAEFNAKLEEKVLDFKEKTNKDYVLNSAEESLSNFYATSVLNAYEIVCQRYRDDKLDKKRFEKTYSKRLARICSRKSYRHFIDSGDFNYSALVVVNKELNDMESK